MRRRDLLKGLAATMPVAVAVPAFSAPSAYAQNADHESPVEALNYALFIEYVEAEFFRQGLQADLLSGRAATWVQQIGEEERAHVALLTETIADIGGAADAAPGLDFGDAFDNQDRFLSTAFMIEQTATCGHLGLLSAVFGNPELVQTVAGVYGVESRHATLIAELLQRPAEPGLFPGPFETPLSFEECLRRLQPFLAGAREATERSATTY